MIEIYADYHTHTKYSHGKGTIMENVLVAKSKGLTEIAITDHGLRHIAFGVRANRIERMRDEIAAINSGISGISFIWNGVQYH